MTDTQLPVYMRILDAHNPNTMWLGKLSVNGEYHCLINWRGDLINCPSRTYSRECIHAVSDTQFTTEEIPTEDDLPDNVAVYMAKKALGVTDD